MPPKVKKKIEGEDRRVDVESLTVSIKAVVAIIIVVTMVVGGAFFWQYQVKEQGEEIVDNTSTIIKIQSDIKSIRSKVYINQKKNDKKFIKIEKELDKKSDKIF